MNSQFSGEILPSKSLPNLVEDWLKAEYAWTSAKFGTHQVSQVMPGSLSGNDKFGGQTAMYWKRMMDARAEGQDLRAAQAAAKVANCTLGLWATIVSFERQSDTAARQVGFQLVRDHLETSDYHSAKLYNNNPDFWETPVGLGLAYLESTMNQRGFASKFRLAYVVRSEQVLLDASDVMALEFERTLEATGTLPKPGLSSGNLEPWEI